MDKIHLESASINTKKDIDKRSNPKFIAGDSGEDILKIYKMLNDMLETISEIQMDVEKLKVVKK